MRLLRLAVEEKRWDLAAHTIILATARFLNSETRRHNQRSGDKPHVSNNKENNKGVKEQSEG